MRFSKNEEYLLWGAAGLGVLYLLSKTNAGQAVESAVIAGGEAIVTAVTSDADFVSQFSPIAVSTCAANGIPEAMAPVIVAWAAMESNFGQSQLAQQTNNLFGVKAGPKWKSEGQPYQDFVTHEYEGTPQEVTITSSFRKYDSWQACADNIIRELQTDFASGGALTALQNGDVTGFLQGIAASGFSTASDYGGRIQNFMSQIANMA